MPDKNIEIKPLDFGSGSERWKRRYIQQMQKPKDKMFFGINLSKLKKEETEKKLIFLIRFYALDRNITLDQALIIIRVKLDKQQEKDLCQ